MDGARPGSKDAKCWFHAIACRMVSSMEVLLVAFPDCCALDLVGPSDVFATASQLAGSDLYTSVLVSNHRDEQVPTESGVKLVSEDSLKNRRESCHTMLVGGGNGFRGAMDDEVLIGAIASVGASARRTASVCSGAFLLAQAGLLDGHRATTHWAQADLLAREFPNVDVVPDAIYVVSGDVMTSAGVTAGIDLALAMVATDHGDELARSVARRMVVYLNRSGGQSQFSERLEVANRQDPGVTAVIATVLADPAGDYSIQNLAALAGMSERNFSRRFRSDTGTTPGRWVERVRVDTARVALEQTQMPPPVVALNSGFQSYDTMRQAFQRVLGVSPARYRNTH